MRKEEALRGLGEHTKGEFYLIIAIDFDGILCENKFPKIGRPNYEVISLTRQLIDMGHEVILWTSRVERELDDAIKWCSDYGLHFCAVNDCAPSNKEEFEGVYTTSPRKIFAHVYIDDRNIEFVDAGEKAGYNSVIMCMKQLKGRKV